MDGVEAAQFATIDEASRQADNGFIDDNSEKLSPHAVQMDNRLVALRCIHAASSHRCGEGGPTFRIRHYRRRRLIRPVKMRAHDVRAAFVWNKQLGKAATIQLLSK